MILTAGQQEQGHGLTEPLLYDRWCRSPQPLVKWAVEVTRLEDLPRIVRRAAKVAMTPPTGPVFISLPGDILNAEAGIELGASTRVDTRVAPVRRGARQRSPSALLAGRAAGDHRRRRDRQERRAARRPPRSPRRWAPPSTSRASPTARISSPSTPASSARSRATRSRCAALLVAIRPADRAGRRPAAHVGVERGRAAARRHAGGPDRPRRLGHGQELSRPRWPCAPTCARRCTALAPVLAKQGGDAARRRGPRHRWPSSPRATGRPSAPTSTARIESRAKATPIDPDWLTLQIADALPRDAVVVNEGLTAGAPPDRSRALSRPLRLPRRWPRAASAGACRRPSAWRWRRRRGRSCCYSGDGSAMYSIQALWTAAHLKLPITYVIANNGGYRIIKQRLQGLPRQRRSFDRHGLRRPEDRLRRPGQGHWACRPSASPSPRRWRRRCSAPSPRPAPNCSMWSSTDAIEGGRRDG